MRRLRLQMMAGGTGLDPDALAFLTAAGITDATITAAIDTLVLDLKGYGIWTKMKAIYPFVGGTATTHKYNLKDPVDSDAAFRIQFNGGWVHNANGIATNGFNTFADTKLNPFVSLGINDGHISIYNRTTLNPISGNYSDIRAFESSPNRWTWISILTSGVQYYTIGSGASGISPTSTIGHFLASRNNSNSVQKGFRNGAITMNVSSSFISHPNYNIYIGAANNQGSASEYQRGGTNYAFASIGDGLTDTEAANYYTAVQAFQTTLGRQV